MATIRKGHGCVIEIEEVKHMQHKEKTDTEYLFL